MKACPTCKMVVDAENECPFCYTTITYEPTTMSNKERYVFNKYFLWYLIKKSWFSVLCSIVVIMRMFFIKTEFHPIFLMPLFLAVLSLIFAVGERQIIKHIQWKYSEGYAEFSTIALKIFMGIIAVAMAFLLR